MLDIPSPNISTNEVASVVCAHFNVQPKDIESVQQLGSEKDKNFKLTLKFNNTLNPYVSSLSLF